MSTVNQPDEVGGPGTDVAPFEHTGKSVKWSPEYAKLVRELEDELGKKICGAFSKTRGGPCEKHPILSRNRCHIHGGRSPRGIDSPHYKNRGWSKDIPKRLIKKIEMSLADPDLTSLAAEIALIDARLGELLGELPEKYTRETWSKVRASTLLAREHLKKSEQDGAVNAIQDAIDALDTIRHERDAWREIYGIIAQRRQLAGEERKREDSLETTVTAKQWAAFTMAVSQSVMDEIEGCEFLDEEQGGELLARIGARLGDLYGVNATDMREL